MKTNLTDTQIAAIELELNRIRASLEEIKRQGGYDISDYVRSKLNVIGYNQQLCLKAVEKIPGRQNLTE